jgi:hypothetical protein
MGCCRPAAASTHLPGTSTRKLEVQREALAYPSSSNGSDDFDGHLVGSADMQNSSAQHSTASETARSCPLCTFPDTKGFRA